MEIPNDRIRIERQEADVRQLEIIAEDRTTFWKLFVAQLVFLFGFFVFEFRPHFDFGTLFVYALVAPFFAFGGLFVWREMKWSRNGKECIRVLPDRIEYSKSGGTRFDHKALTIPLDPAKAPVVDALWVYDKGNLRVRLKVGKRTLFFGRWLSKDDANRVRDILSGWLHPAV